MLKTGSKSASVKQLGLSIFCIEKKYMVGCTYMPSNNFSDDRNERIIARKNNAKKELLGKYKLPKTTRYVSCIDLHDSKTRDFVIQGLADL